MNPFVSRISSSNWVVPVSLLSLVLGFMIAMARVTGAEMVQRRPQAIDRSQLDRITAGPLAVQERVRALTDEVTTLREENARYQKLVAEQEDGSKALHQSLEEAKRVASLTPLQGPGVTVTMSDFTPVARPSDENSPHLDIPVDEQIIHDQDILRVVNELYSAGAEAISINNLRLGNNSRIRCVGPTVLIDEQKVASPIRIRAIGDPEALYGGLTMPGGIYQELRSVDEKMIAVEKNDMITVPAYAGPTNFKHAKPQPTQS